jgi:hypothetical protein
MPNLRKQFTEWHGTQQEAFTRYAPGFEPDQSFYAVSVTEARCRVHFPSESRHQRASVSSHRWCVPTTSLVHIDHNNSIDYTIIDYNITDFNITDYLYKNPPSLMGVDESVPLGGAVVYNLLPAKQLFPTNCPLQEPHGSSQVFNLRCELHGTRLPVSSNLYPVSLTSGSGQLNYKKAATDSATPPQCQCRRAFGL